MRVILTGSRHWTAPQVINKVIGELHKKYGDDLEIVHGNNSSGADRQARRYCDEMLISQDKRDADWRKYGNAAGPIRNQEMVDSGADLCIAFPDPHLKSSGTWDCIQKARADNIPVKIYNEQGEETETAERPRQGPLSGLEYY